MKRVALGMVVITMGLICLAGPVKADPWWTGTEGNKLISHDDGLTMLALSIARTSSDRVFAVWLEDASDDPFNPSVVPHLGELMSSSLVGPWWTSKDEDFPLNISGNSWRDGMRSECSAVVVLDPLEKNGDVFFFAFWIRLPVYGGTYQLCLTSARFPANEFEPYSVETEVIREGCLHLSSPNILMADELTSNARLFISWIEKETQDDRALPYYLEFDPFDPNLQLNELEPNLLGTLGTNHESKKLVTNVIGDAIWSIAAIKNITSEYWSLMYLQNPSNEYWQGIVESELMSIESICVDSWRTPEEDIFPCAHYILKTNSDEATNESSAYNYFTKYESDGWMEPAYINPGSAPEFMTGPGLLVSKDTGEPWLVTWSHRDDGQSSDTVFASYSTDQGTTWAQSLETVCDVTEGLRARDTNLFRTPGGAPAVVWSEMNCPNPHFEVLVSYRVPDGEQ